MQLLSLLMLLSGLSALSLELVWLRRLSLEFGSAGLSATITLSIYMGGLGIGSIWSSTYHWKKPTQGYGILELCVAGWGFAFPFLLHFLSPFFTSHSNLYILILSCPLLLPPAIAHGATLPALSSTTANPKDISQLYAYNTFGAVLGVLLSSFFVMPTIGIRGTEIFASFCCGIAGCIAWLSNTTGCKKTVGDDRRSVPTDILIAAGIAGTASMALEIIWSRLGALLIGGSVYAFAVVLAVFLLGIAIGADLSKKMSKEMLPMALRSIGFLATIGCIAWRWLPHGLALSWGWFGDGSQLPTGAVLLTVAMAGAPVASGMVFGLCLKHGTKDLSTVTGKILTSNTIGGVIGVFFTGTYLLPLFGIYSTTIFISSICVLYALYLQPRKWYWVPIYAFLYLCLPSYDIAIYATGLYNRIGEFVDVSPRAIEKFTHEGWDARFYQDGESASVAVGQSKRTQNLWLSINGKVDASTGDDMPTQILSGQLPLQIHPSSERKRTLVIGLASGVTANEAYKSGGKPLTIVELEPAIVEASTYFHSVNESIFEKSEVQVRVADARTILARENILYDVIISEPSNPWITGVSNLFTVEYWKLGRKRLSDNGVFCQWVQLYALPPEGFRSLIASYVKVFPNTWLFETIPGSDALLISAPKLPSNISLKPTLGPDELRKMSQGARYNTDDHPWIEFEAPKWINRSTGKTNRQIIESYSSE